MTHLNCLPAGDTVDQFHSFQIRAMRADPDDAGAVMNCLVSEAEFWSLYGWVEEGASFAIHDEPDLGDLLRVAQTLLDETGKEITYVDHGEGRGYIGPVANLDEMAIKITLIIRAEGGNDTHELAAFKKACIEASRDTPEPNHI